MITPILHFISENPKLMIGNVFGFAAVVFAFMAFQAKTPIRLLLLNSCVVISVIFSYGFLGAWSGMVINIVCLFRNVSYLFKNCRIFSFRGWPYLWAVIIGGLGVCFWQGPISLLVIVALMINTIWLSFGDNKKMRQSVLVTSSMVIIYDFRFQAYLALLMEAMAIVSSAVGLIRYRGKKEQN